MLLGLVAVAPGGVRAGGAAPVAVVGVIPQRWALPESVESHPAADVATIVARPAVSTSFSGDDVGHGIITVHSTRRDERLPGLRVRPAVYVNDAAVLVRGPCAQSGSDRIRGPDRHVDR